MTTQQIIALANAGFTAQQIDTFSQAMGANPAGMSQVQTAPAQPVQVQTIPAQPVQVQTIPAQQVQTVPAQQVQTVPAQPVQVQTTPVQNTQHYASVEDYLARESERQIASMNQAPAVTPQVTIGMGGNAGNASMIPQVLAQYQADNRYNAGMSMEKPPTMTDITDQIINGAVQEATKK